MKIKTLGIFAILMIAFLAFCGIASAAITITEVELNEDSLGNGTNIIRDVERGEEFTVKVHCISDKDLENVQVEAYIRGYDHDDLIEDITDVFDMKANVTYVKKLTLKLPERMDQDRYELRVRIEGRNGDTAYNDYTLEVDTQRHNLEIKDIVLSPEISVKAGRALLATVRVKNYGEKDEESVKVKVSIPELGISASDYIDEIEAEDSEQSEELYMRIPEDAKPGTYEVVAEVIYDDGDEKTTKTTTIEVIGEEEEVAPQPSLSVVITVGNQKQDVKAGGTGVVYPIIISNPTNEAKTATLTINGASEWATTSITPSNVIVIQPGETKAAYIYLAVKEGVEEGEHMFSVSVSGLGETKEITFTANVTGSEEISGLKRGLEIGLIVLVAIIVIVGLIIGFRKIKSSETEKEETETYY